MTTTISDELAKRIDEHLAKNPRAMTLELARSLEVPESEIVRRLPEGRSTALDVSRFEEIMQASSKLERVFVIVSNASATMESTGQLGGFSRSGAYFNVQSDSIDMHIRTDKLSAAFAVQKPSHMDGVSTLSVQFFDDVGASSFKVFFSFGSKAPTEQIQQVWTSIRRDFATA